MTFHTDDSMISISYLYGAEAIAVMSACMDSESEEEDTIDNDTFDDATTVYQRPRDASRDSSPALVT